MVALGVIVARGGSKGIPGKNLASVGGRPLIAWTIDAAKASRRLNHVVVSTDDPQIAAEAERCGVRVPVLRPASLAEDDTPILPVLVHAAVHLAADMPALPDVVVLLQPTSPLRSSTHIDQALELLEKTGAASVVSVVEVPHQFNPVSVMLIHEDRLVPFAGTATVTRRQDKPKVYARNGPAVLAVRTDVIVKHHSLYGDDVRPLFMSAEDSIDIDMPWDLDVADWLLRRRNA